MVFACMSLRYPKMSNGANHALDSALVRAAAARNCAEGLSEECHVKDLAGNAVLSLPLAFPHTHET